MINADETTLKNNCKKQQEDDGMSGLDKSLAPLFKMTRYSGLLYDWCTHVDCKNQVWKWVFASFQTMMVFGSLFISICAMVLYSIRLVVVYNNLNNGVSQDFLFELIMSSSVPLVLLTQIYYLLRRSALLNLFYDWRHQLLDVDVTNSTEKKIIFIYCIYFGSIVGFVGNLAQKVFCKQLIMDDLFSEKAFGTYLQPAGYILFGASFLVSIFCTVIDIVPSFVYYRAGLAVQVLIDRSKSILLQRDQEKIQQIISLYNSIGRLVTRADYLFGPLIVLNNGVTFFVTCSLTSTILKPSLWTRTGDFRNEVSFYFILFLSRFVWPILFKSKLHNSSERLKSIVHSSYSEFSSCVIEHNYQNTSATIVNTHKSAVEKLAFLLANKILAACPCGLYRITPSILLTMLSLLATYTIIIIQS